MRVTGRVLRCLACCAFLLLGWCSAAVAAAPATGGTGASRMGTSSASARWLVRSLLVVPEVDRLLGGDQSEAAWVAARSGPGMFAARRASATSFEGLSAGRVAGEAGRAFPDLVARPVAGVSRLPAGARLLRYRTDGAAEVLVGGRRGIVESVAPMAVRLPHGGHAALDLSLTQAGGRYVPVRSEAHVSMPTTLSSGVSLSEVGVSLTPVDAHGRPLSASPGKLEGGAVLWRDSEGGAGGVRDLATLAKPSAVGFDLSTLLLSQRSSGSLYFRVGMPVGARLRVAQDGSVRVVRKGATLASIPPARARDAEGTEVHVSTAVRGDVVVLGVDRPAGAYAYPLLVDPEVNDTQLATTTGGKRSNWEFHTSNGARFAGAKVYEGVGKEHLETKGIAEYVAGEWAYWGYETKGNSKIYELKAKTSAKNTGSKIESFLEFEAPGGAEKPKKVLSTELSEPEYSEKATTICAWNASKVEECLPAVGKEKNAVHFQQSATASPGGKYNFWDSMSEGIVSISEPSGTHSTTSYNTGSAELEFEVEVEGKKERIKRKNALYGTSNWLSKYEGALEMIAKDPGIGVAATKLEYESAPNVWTLLSKHEYLEKENSCQGVQCYATHNEFWTLDPKLPDGQQKISYRAEEAMAGTVSLESEGQATVKVDATAPHRLNLSGLPWGNELSEKPYELTGEATDGEGSTVASSGVKSLALYIDGQQFGASGGSCKVAKGECTASMKWTVNGAELGAGHHKIYLVAFDNAGNEARLYEQISIRHSTPVPLGPGSVDLESGDYSLGSGDVSMGSGLSVGRNYSSRNLTQGDEGPLGPEWSLSLGSTESLTEMVDGAVLLTSANGSQTIFAPLGEGKFESPPGDSNLALSLEENKETKQKLAYYLKDSAKHTSVKFTRPMPGTAWVPTKQEGTAATDTVTYKYQGAEQYTHYQLPTYLIEGVYQGALVRDVTKGPDGNLWIAVINAQKILKLSTTGALTEYSVFNKPEHIVTGPDGNLWISFYNSNEIVKMNPYGKVVGEYFVSTSAHQIVGLTAGPDGNVWFLDQEDMVGKITPTGSYTEYAVHSGSILKGIATGPDGNVWYTAPGMNVIGKVTPSGIVTEYTIPAANSNPWGITAGSDGNMWFAELFSETSPHKIGKITPAGVVTEYTLPSGTEPRGSDGIKALVSGPDGNVWFVELNPKKIGKITPSGTVSQYSLPYSPGSMTIGPDSNIWFDDEGKIGTMPSSGVTLEPSEALAPKPAGVSCEPELKAGCRALKFKYATKTTARGENKSEWGEFEGRLKTVLLDAYNPSTKTMQETAVAEYSYDNRGRLRAEWDPRISPALKTTYGYDEEGHVTALDPPGQEPWTFTYGTAAGDAGAGRLVKIARAPVSEALWNGEVVKNTTAPQITGSPVPGVRMTVSDGSWSGSPLTYGYQWEDCNGQWGQLEGCKPIVGATSANYTPTSSDVGYTLRTLVTATNGGGSASVMTAAVGFVKYGQYTQTVDSPNSLNAAACVPGSTHCVVSDSLGKAFYATNVTPSAAATWNAWSGPGTSPSGALACPTDSLCLMADGGNLYYATALGGAWTLAYSPSYGVDAISCPSSSFCVDGQNGSGFFRYSTNPPSTSWTLEKQGTAAMKAVSCVSSSFCAIADGAGSVHVATSTAQIESSAWTETKVNGTSALNGVACASTTSCVAVDGTGNMLNLTVAENGTVTATKQNIDGTNKLTAVACPIDLLHLESICTTVDNQGNVFVSADGGASWSRRYALGGNLTSVACKTNVNWDCVTASTIGSVTAFEATAISEGEARGPQPGTALEYGVSLSGGSGLPNMTSGEVGKWGQKDVPVEATAIVPPDSPQGWPASDYKRASVYYLDEEGRTVNVSAPSASSYGSISTTEYDEETHDVIRTLSADNRVKALEAGAKSVEVSKLLDTQYTYNSPECRKETPAKETETAPFGTRLCETWGPQHTVKYMVGKEQRESLARNHTKYFYEDAAHGAPAGETYDLVTETSDLALLANEEEVEVRKTTTSYSGQSNLGWKLRAPTSVTEDPEGKKITHMTLYNSTTGQIVETRGPAGLNGESAHDARTIYYSAEANTEGFTACGLHPEWAGLVCETLPAKQSGTPGVPNLPVTTTPAYNMYNEPETVTETFGSVTRTKKETYDSAGRLTNSETTSTEDRALPAVKEEYNSTTGVLEKQSTTVEAKTQTLTSKYNKLGQMVEYTDADGNTATYTYGGPEKDYLLEAVSDGAAGGTAKQTYTYNSTTKQLEELKDSAAGTFTASYDAEGKLVSEVYPNGMCANTAYNPVGEATHIEYIKTTNCKEEHPTVWFSETRTASVRGETFARSSTLANETYGYDTVGRLTETQETPAGEGCSERIYAYDEESNRLSLTKRAPGTGGVCATEGGSVETHTYDEGNRLTDAGIEYDGFGNVKKLPAADAEGHELVSAFYVDGAVASQSQNGVSHEYKLDPAGRARETISGATPLITHYDGPGEAVTWTSESTEKWTRDIPGIDGTLSAVQTNGGTPVLQLHDLQGNITATAELNIEATKLLSTYNSTEFGVPNKEKAPPKYAWLGAGGIESAFSSGVVTYGSTSYVPQTGRALQGEEVEPPGLPGGSGAGAAYTSQEEPWNMQGAAAEGAEAPGLEAGREQTAFEASASVIDPYKYLSRTKARILAGELKKISSIAEILSFLDIPKDATEFVEKYILDAIGLDVAFAWFHDASAKLEKCANNHRWAYGISDPLHTKKLYANVCYYTWGDVTFTVPIINVKISFVYFPEEPRVWDCYREPGLGDVCPLNWEVHINQEL